MLEKEKPRRKSELPLDLYQVFNYSSIYDQINEKNIIIHDKSTSVVNDIFQKHIMK